MQRLNFITGNKNKFHTAQQILGDAGITLIQEACEIDEIQSEDAELIARDKARKAFNVLEKPLVISDDSWSIPGLNGFPGAYMKSMNHWLSAEDFLRLTLPLADRRVDLIQIAVYQDKTGQRLFKKTITGTLLKSISEYQSEPSSRIISLTKDGRSLAEVRTTNPRQLAEELDTVWHDVTTWLSNENQEEIL